MFRLAASSGVDIISCSGLDVQTQSLMSDCEEACSRWQSSPATRQRSKKTVLCLREKRLAIAHHCTPGRRQNPCNHFSTVLLHAELQSAKLQSFRNNEGPERKHQKC